MPERYTAESVEAAIELADGFKRAGTYRWFRGQRSPWPPWASLARLDEPARVAAAERVGDFYRFAANTPGLEFLIADGASDDFFAVAQHYGIPTNYLDFTTDPGVAGYFAAASAGPDDPKGYIYCLDPEDLIDLWSAFEDRYPRLELITRSVPNLWRLEAQRGTFLYAPVANWDAIYPMDVIIFSQNGLPAFPTTADVLPVKKSQLELILDQFFSAERTRAGYKAFVNMFEKIAEQNPNFKMIETNSEHPWEESEIVGGSPPVVAGWDRARERWNQSSHEPLDGVLDVERRLKADFTQPAKQVSAKIAFGINQALLRDRTLRGMNVTWQLTSLPPNGDAAWSLANQVSLRTLWNGLRTLPYDDTELALALANCMVLCARGVRQFQQDDVNKPLIEELLGDVMEVEFGAADGSYSRGFVGVEALRAAVRSDIADILIHPRHASSIKGLLRIIWAPDRLFGYDALAALFAAQIAPTQVLLRSHDGLFFSPARLNAFGLS